MHGSCLFRKLNLAASYHQTCIGLADWQTTAFTTKFCLSEWRVLLFGRANKPSQFMCMLNGILEPIKHKFIIIYLDDILIYSHTQAEHIVHVSEVLTSLTEHGFEAKRAIGAWASQKVDFYGFDIDKDGIHTQK
jgi:hypothetical protein